MIMSIGVIAAVTSTDGTSIGYRMIGQGPGLVILHGAMESAPSHSELAAEVGDSHTVYLPDRRGRGMSGPHRANHDINTEVDDLAAVLAATGATDVLGVSSGAVIALEASLRLPQLHRVAIFEPPLIVGNSLSTSFVARYREELGRGDLPSARRRIQPGLPANHDGCPRRRPADGTPDHISQTWPRRYGECPLWRKAGRGGTPSSGVLLRLSVESSGAQASPDAVGIDLSEARRRLVGESGD
jgi:pimeloyl-ACP methyl ester carboxylesterase